MAIPPWRPPKLAGDWPTHRGDHRGLHCGIPRCTAATGSTNIEYPGRLEMSQATTSLDPHGGSDPLAALRRRAIMSCMIGNFLEIYDFTVYGFFATFIGQTFFPSGDSLVSLLSSFATFGVGFVMRPI